MPSPRRVINGKGPATVLGGAQVPEPVIDAMARTMRTSVHMGELQHSAGSEIARVIGAEAAFVTGCAAAGMSIGIAAAIGGNDMSQVTSLPRTLHDRNEVVIQKAHMIIVGGCDANQVIRLAGGEPVEVGTAADCADFHLRTGLTDRTAAGLFVEGERAHGSGTLSLRAFADQCHEAGVPVIVDAAGTHDPEPFFDDGADVVVFSVHKWFRGPTAGVLAGQKDLIDASFLHAEFGVGRPMKAGKEGVAGALAAVRHWSSAPTGSRLAEEQHILDSIQSQLTEIPGLTVREVATEHESTAAKSIRLDVQAQVAGIQAWQVAEETERADPSVVLYDYEAAQGYLLIDPGFLNHEEVPELVEAIQATMDRAAAQPHDLSATPPPRFATLTRTMAAWSQTT